MRKLLSLMLLLVLGLSLHAQQYVSTQPANRNVVLEEFTGRNCGYCTDGHAYANQIAAANPGRVWAVNVHFGSLSPTSYPNLNLPQINPTISNAFPHDGIPSGVVNRSTAQGQNRGQWNNLATAQLNQAAECNVGGRVVVNPVTRIATLTVEVYYTANSTENENYLTVMMLQDSILGAQQDYGNYNPSGWLNGEYVHQHVLRDIVTTGIWGEAISPTTQGTLITKTYEYSIPESIGSPNGVEVKIEHINFLAFVTEKYQGTPTRPILNACELEKVIGSNDPYYPAISSISLLGGGTCSQTKTVTANVSNIGTSTLTSFVLNAEFEGTTQTQQWEGSLAPFESVDMNFMITAPFGTHNMHFEITQANGAAFSGEANFPVECLEWMTLETENDSEELKIVVMQDKWGQQTTWEITDSEGQVLGSGGPYNTLPGSNATQVQMDYVTVPANECVKFTIYDSGENGICCNYGDGYYKIYDSGNNLLVDGDGAFGSEASHLFSIVGPGGPSTIQITTLEPQIVGDHSANFLGAVKRDDIEAAGFEYKKLVDPQVQVAVAQLNGSTFTARVDDLELNTMYSVKAYAIVNQEYVYGDEVHFHTWVEGVGELERSLKVYPNPANDRLTVEGEMTSVQVYNTLGQCLITKQVDASSVQVDLSGLDNGIYFLRVSNNGETAVRKVTVNR